MGKSSNEIIAATSGIVQEEWQRDESEHPYKFVPTKASGNAVPFPAITKCNTFILRHYAAGIVEEIGQRMYDGDLAMYFDIPDFTEDCMTMLDCRISPSMSFWWQDRFSFLADLEVYIEADVHTDSIYGRQSAAAMRCRCPESSPSRNSGTTRKKNSSVSIIWAGPWRMWEGASRMNGASPNISSGRGCYTWASGRRRAP